MTLWTRGMGAIIKALPRSKKVSPDIKSVKPTKHLKGSVKRGKSKEYTRRIDKLSDAERKVSEGKKMMKEGQRERKRMQETGTAFKFKHSKRYHALEPGDKTKYNIDKKGISKGSK